MVEPTGGNENDEIDIIDGSKYLFSLTDVDLLIVPYRADIEDMADGEEEFVMMNEGTNEADNKFDITVGAL